MFRPVCIVVVACLIHSARTAEPELGAMRPARSRPTIDGAIDLGEWRDAVGFAGAGFGSAIDPRTVNALVAIDQEAVYVAMRSELPPGEKLTTDVKRRGGNVIRDDCIEIWIAPPREGRPDGPRGNGHFQVLINADGVMDDKHHEPGYGLTTRDWGVDMSFAGRFHNGMWEVEMAFPLRELGVKELVTPSVWRMHVVRNFKNPWHQANVANGSSFSDKAGMLELHVTEDAPTIQVLTLGALHQGKPGIQVRTVYGDRPVTLSCQILAGDTATADESRILTSELTLTRIDSLFQPAEKNVIHLSVSDPAGRVWYRRHSTFTPEPEHRWTHLAAFETFSVSFDDDRLTARQARGATEPLKITGQPEFVPGVSGNALLVNEGAQFTWDNAENLPVPCGVSFWVQPRRKRRKGKAPHPVERTAFFQTRHHTHGSMGVQDSVYGRLQLWFHFFPDLTKQRNVLAPFPWEKNRWYHIAFNISDSGADLFLDGLRIGGTTFDRPLRAEELRPFIVGGVGHANGYAIDELKIYSRPFSKGEVAKLSTGDQPFEGQIAFFPSLPALLLDTIVNGEGLAECPMRLKLSDAGETTLLMDAAVAVSDFNRIDDGMLQTSRTYDLPKLAEGQYKAWLEYVPAGSTVVRRALQRGIVVEHYPWEGNQLGLSDAIVAPFTPLEVKDNTVNCILREHKLGELGLWEQVHSLEKPLLARPVSLEARADGKPMAWEHGPIRFLEVKPHRVTFAARSTCAAAVVQAKGVWDYDGLMELTLRLEPRGKASLDRLYVDIPVRPEIATLFHAVGEGIRSNPAGAVPDGEGVVWHSRLLPQPTIDNFLAYLWVGGEERGICYAADWDRGWTHCEERDAVELIRESDAVTIRLNLINGPLVLDGTREIDFALMASPAKPMPPDWREWTLRGPHPGDSIFNILWGWSWGNHYGWAGRYPVNQSFDLIDAIMKTRETGEIDGAAIKSWVGYACTFEKERGKTIDRKRLESHVRFSFNVARGMHRHDDISKLVYYTNAYDPIGGLPEFPVYGDEWGFRDGRHHVNQSFRDYSIYWIDQMQQRGFRGIYVDNTFLVAKHSWPVGDAYLDKRGQIHPGLGLLSRDRAFIRRIAVMMHERGREPFAFVHMTNAATLPMLSFAQVQLAWEFKYGANDYQERFTPDYMRTVNTGRQFGAIPILLGGTQVKNDPPEHHRVSRTGFAMALPHETFFYSRVDYKLALAVKAILKDFRTGAYDAFPYWKNTSVVKTIPGDLLITVYRKADRLLLVVGNQGDEGMFPITLQAGAISGTSWSAVNRETATAVPVNQQGVIQLELARHDFALIEVMDAESGNKGMQ